MSLNQTPSLRIVSLTAVCLGLACCGLAYLYYSSRLEVERLATETAGLRAELNAAHQKTNLAAVQKPKRAVPPRGSDASPTSVSGQSLDSEPASAKAESKRRVDAEAMSSLIKSPMMQKIMASQTTALLQMTYGQLMDHLQLSPEEREYLQRLLVEKQTSLQNLGIQMMNPNLSEEDRKSIMTKLSDVWTSGEAKIREFLNDEADFAYYQTYSKQEPERREVGMLQDALKDGEPLDPATSNALATLQSEARKNFPFTVDFYNQENFGNPANLNRNAVQTFLEEQTKFQADVADQASKVLTPAQLEVYKQNQAAVRHMAGMQLNSIMQMVGAGQ